MQKFKTTCAIVLNKNNEALLIKRGREPFKDYWALVSGIGESKKGVPPDDAIKGEIAGDLGTKSFVGSQIFSLPVKNDETTDEVIVYVGRINESEIVFKPGYSEDFRWVAMDKLVLENLAFEHTDIIKKYLNEKNSD